MHYRFKKINYHVQFQVICTFDFSMLLKFSKVCISTQQFWPQRLTINLAYLKSVPKTLSFSMHWKFSFFRGLETKP